MSYSFNQGQGGFGSSNNSAMNAVSNRFGQGGGNDAGGGKSSSNPSSIDAMFQGILPSSGSAVSASPANARQLSGLNHMNLGTMTAAGIGVHQAQLPSTRLQTGGLGVNVGSHHGQDFSNSVNINSASLSDEIKRLQQLHQLTQGQGGAASATSASNTNQLMQELLAGRSGAAMSQLGVKNTAMTAGAAHPMFLQQSALQQSNANAGGALGSLSQREAAFVLMSQQQQQQQQQAALQQQQQQVAFQQQQLQQQLASGLISPSAAAQLMAASAGQMLPSPSMLSARAALGGQPRPGPGAIEPFPEKLHRMLMEVEASGKAHIISFVDEGRAFAIHKPNQFFKVRTS